jgi:putative Holliday junction resolvase
VGRILAIDYGLKRTGLAVSDPLQIIATALEAVETPKVFIFLKTYFQKEAVDKVVIGMPRQLNNEESQIAPQVKLFVEKFKTTFPSVPIFLVDERFTSVMAHRAMIEGGMKKKERRVKGNIDKISATIILQQFMESNSTQ